MKKTVMISCVGLMAILTGCGNSEANKEKTSTNNDNKLVLSTFGLSEDIFKVDVVAPFEKEFDASVVLDVGNSSDRYTKLLSNKNSGIDVVELAQNHGNAGHTEGLFEELTEEKIPNISQLTEGAKEVLASGAGVPIAVNSIGIIYDKEAVGHDITSWEQLWETDLKGKLSVPDITSTGGPLMMYVASEQAGTAITDDNGEAAFEKMAELKPNVVKTYSKSSDLANMFQSGEIEVAVVADFAVDIIQKASDSAVYVVPESGTYANFNTINVLKNSANKELAYEFINARISESQQEAKALSLNEGPVNVNVTLSDKDALNKTYGDIASRAKTVDFNMVNKLMNDWVDKWNRLMNQ